MIIIGGRSHHNYNNPLPIEVYNLENFESYEFHGIGMNRQSSFILDKYIYLYGGFNEKNSSQPIGTLSKINLENLFEGSPLLNEIKTNKNNTNNNTGNVTKNTNNKANTSTKKSKFKLSHEVVIGSGGIMPNENEENEIEDTSNLFRKISIDKLQEENKRIGENNSISNNLLESVQKFDKNLISKFIYTLLRPFDWFDAQKMNEIHNDFPFTQIEIFKLLKEVKPIFEKEKTLIKIRSPCKIFGNLFGCYNDLMRFFESFGNPSDNNQMGDINVMQYLFLGDFCDRGIYSLEIILLLFALKIKYPDFIYIIRGHHEDSNINFYYGLGQECKERLADDITNSKSIFCLINKIFDLLPLGILIDNNILCLHGGIGSSVNTLEDIENIKRPINVIQEVTNTEHQKILDILWSEYSQDIDYVDINTERDVSKNGFIVKYGKKRLNKFLLDNKINLLITSHMFIKEGFKTFNNDKLLIVYSATNYMDKYKNLGGMIIIAKKTKNKPMNILPKLINIFEGKKDNFRKDRNPSPIH
jgi:diadenosine tetraphosphatase ApaH/serine/threonine PP2A family protein phosphatase